MNRLLVVILGLCSSAFVIAGDCKGRWSVTVENSSVQYLETKAKIPVYVQLSSEIRRCAPQGIYIRAGNRNDLSIMSGNDRLQGQIVDSGGAKSGIRTSKGMVMPLNQGRQTKFWFEFPAAKYASAGRYDANLTFSLVGIKPRVIKKEILALNIHPYVELSLNGQNRKSTVVNFGEMTEGKSKVVDLSMSANTLVDVYFSADNEYLVHEDNSNSRVRYSMFLNNAKVDFNKPIPMHKLSYEKSSNSLKIILGSIKKAQAGNYSDKITITAHAKP
ncbi:hypothetical protein BCT04_12260 [Vibrio breoganii]|uniref:hypothetical protein n=1 Tax=Vibrio breoganii TaxID=553239 RepID=UPI000C8166E9|nr:hypothetical protein [Vibrio breoganii]PML17975.1 hypothetical protein BCT84_04725 [Vibrio breoganii]PML83886.1 hypothetical protein BCT68_01090 [Vibrio breoganii]PMO65753.1 hypothetical protein BCT04_12260 [Vibrio breoganii]